VTEFERRRARISVGEIAYLEGGDAGNPTVVFVHGFPASSFLWREFLPLFAPWMHVVAPDLIGAGDSDKPVSADVAMGAQAGYLRELLEHLGVSEFAVVGHSHGGGMAQLLALQGAGVGAMVLIDSVAFDARPLGLVPTPPASSRDEATEANVRAVLRSGLERGIAHAERLTDELVDAYARPYAGEAATTFLTFARALDGVGDLEGREAELARLECPVLILWGEEDRYLSVEVAERLCDAIPTSALALLPGCGHFLPEEAPETIAPLTFDYLRSRYLGRPHVHGESGRVSISLERNPPGGR
jgi:pimeloyl-ACP methyl ester carboxylesterase